MGRTRVYTASPLAPFITGSQWTLEVGVAGIYTLRNVGPRIFGGGRDQKISPQVADRTERNPGCPA
jgi:hypothetical protein